MNGAPSALSTGVVSNEVPLRWCEDRCHTRRPCIETAALMLETDKSRGYCLEMICADFLAGANMDLSNPEILRQSISHYYKFLPIPQQEAFRSEISGKAS